MWKGIDAFEGTLDGDFNTIYGMNIYVNTYVAYNEIGFFRSARGATIKNLVLSSGTIYAYDEVTIVGGLIANAGHCTVSNCIVEELTISVSGDCVGLAGVIGYANGGTIINTVLKDSSISLREVNTGFGSNIASLACVCSVTLTVKNCSAINVKIYNVSTDDSDIADFVFTENGAGSSIISSYAWVSIAKTGENMVVHKTIYGSSSNFGDWMFNANINRGYPVQKSLLTVSSASSQTSAQVYSQLVDLGFTTA